MKFLRPQNSATLAWIAFASCAILVVGAMLWLTHNVIKTEQERAEAELRAELQERVRISLWRMDSLGTSLLLEENSIPPHLFLSTVGNTLPSLTKFETPDGAAIRCEGPATYATAIPQKIPSIISNLNIEEIGKQQAPSPQKSVTEEKIQTQIINEYQFRNNSKGQEISNTWAAEDRNLLVEKSLEKSKRYNGSYDEAQVPNSSIATEKKAESEGTNETEQDLQLSAPVKTEYFKLPKVDVATNQTSTPIGDFKASWQEDSLFLIRRGLLITNFAQGTLIDHEALAKLLNAEAIRLLPNATLTRPYENCDSSFVLASFPFQLHPGSLGFSAESIPKTISNSLMAGWIAAIAALITAYFLIANMMKLSERRASFVSAVTHELRTPLTTFRLYSDMLATGAVREEKKPAYLNVLSREADRLSHLVENVLAFSKIERGSARSNITEIEINSFLESQRERFESRLQAASLSLQLDTCPAFNCRLDTSALEHILFNLIDNAAKYATSSSPPVITITPITKSCSIEIHIADNGPGIPKSEIRRIFKPFHKSAKQAAESKPGIGLGLSLSQRLAHSMGGSLTCQPKPNKQPGALFILRVPCKQKIITS